MANAVAAYAKIPGITGDSDEPRHIQWIEILSVDWGGAKGSLYGNSAARSSRVGDKFIFRKRVDVASARLGAAAAAGTRIPQVEVEIAKSVRTMTQSGAEADSHFVLLFRSVVIASVHHGAAQREEYPSETVALNYGSVESQYR